MRGIYNMAVQTTEKEVEITLSERFQTNGRFVGPGKVRVPASVADDLKRREHEFIEDQKRLLQSNGETIDALKGDTLRG